MYGIPKNIWLSKMVRAVRKLAIFFTLGGNIAGARYTREMTVHVYIKICVPILGIVQRVVFTPSIYYYVQNIPKTATCIYGRNYCMSCCSILIYMYMYMY